MKTLYSFLFLLTASFWGWSLDLNPIANDFESDDYAVRQDALNQLASIVAKASHPEADRDQRGQLELALIEKSLQENLPVQSRIYFIRSLAKVASGTTTESLIRLLQQLGYEGIVASEAVETLAQSTDGSVTASIVEAMKSAPEQAMGMFWNLLATRRDSTASALLIKAFEAGKLALSNEAIVAIANFGDQDMSRFLFSCLTGSPSEKRDLIIRTIIKMGQASPDQLMALAKELPPSVLWVSVVEQLLEKDRQHGVDTLWSLISLEPSLSKVLVGVAARINDPFIWDSLMNHRGTLNDEACATLYQMAAESGRREYEPFILADLDTMNPSVKIAAYQCLGIIGSEASTPVLMEQMNSSDEKVKAVVLSALAVLRDPGLDVRLLEQVRKADTGTPDAIQLLAVRNSPGALDELNHMLAKPLDPATTKAVLSALEEIGDVTTCKLLLLECLNTSDKTRLRAVQTTLKRLSMRIELPDLLWQTCYHPAILLAPTPEIEARIAVILDGISTPEAQAYCIKNTESDSPELRTAANQALMRWRSVEVCDYWIRIVADKNANESQKKQALDAIIRTIGASYTLEGDYEKGKKAADLFFKSNHPELRSALIDAVIKLGVWPARGFKQSLEPYLDAGDYLSRILEMGADE